MDGLTCFFYNDGRLLINWIIRKYWRCDNKKQQQDIRKVFHDSIFRQGKIS